eukprot:gene14150-16274_t
MGDSAALVERMSTAVRTAYKAIEVLKEENKALKAENETLKLQIQALSRSQQPDIDYSSDEPASDGSPIASPVVLSTARMLSTSTLKPLQQSKPLSAKLELTNAVQLPLKTAVVKSSTVDTYVPVDSKSALLVEECGLNKPSCSTNFGNSPEAKKIIVFLKELSLQNVHVLAKSIAPTLLTQLDLLGNLVVSLASRTSNGMIRASKLMAIVKKVILGAIRCQWMSPHYTLVMGTTRSHRVATTHHTAESSKHGLDDHGASASQVDEFDTKIKHEVLHTEVVEHMETVSDGKESEDLDSRGHDGVPDEALSSESEAEEEEEREKEPLSNPIARPSLAAWGLSQRSAAPTSSASNDQGELGATVVPQSARKAALSSMFGLDDSSEDEEDDHENKHVKEENDEEDDVFMTNDNDMDVEDSDSVQKRIINNNKSEVTVAPVQAEMKPAAEGSDKVDHMKGSAAGGGVMDHACKVYFLLSSLVRLRLAHELVCALQEMRLVTFNNLSVGAVLGTVSVLGSSRYRALGLRGVRPELIALLRQWYTELSTVLEMHTPHGDQKVEYIASLSVTLLTAQSVRDLVGAFLAHLVPQQTLPEALSLDKTSLAKLLTQNEVSWDIYELQSKFRREGLWGTLTSLNSRKAELLWDKLGLDRLPLHAQRVEEMLYQWNPAAENRNPPLTLSVKDFVNSDGYLFSSLQSVVQGTLKAARIAPERLIAEELLVQEFTAHWKDHIASLSDNNSADTIAETHKLSRSVKCLSELLQTFLSTEYDAPEGGWRSGLSGDGFRLSSRLDNRLTVGLALLQKLIEHGSGVTNFVPSSAMVMLKPSLQWMHYSSLSSRKTLEYAEFLDHCVQEVFPDGAPTESAASGQSEKQQLLHTIEVKLYAVCCEIAALMALASVEALVFAFVSSLRGLLSAVRSEAKIEKDKKLHVGVAGLVREAVSCLCKLPSPWAGVSRADIQHELLESTRLLFSLEESTNHTRLLGAEWMLRLSVCQPVFVINLDKRTDRYRRLLIMLDQASLCVVRIRAFDGTTTNQTSSLTPAEMFQRSFGAQQDPSADISSLSAARAVPCIEDGYDSIPESDVQLTWDSTLNNKFDPRCPVNARTVATPSERACAASHLRVWRTIAAVRGTKVAKSKLRGLQSLLGTSSETPSEGALASPEVIYKDLLTLKSGGQQSVPAGPSGGGTSSSSENKEVSQTQMSVLEESLHPQEGIDYFIVFEDDVCFPQQSLVDLRATIQSIMRVLPASVDILYLCGVLPKACADVDILYLCGVLPKACAEFKLRNIKGDPFFSINYAWTLQAYVLRSRAVEVLLSKLPIFAPVDNFVASLIYHGELRACIVKDKLTQRLAGALLPGGGRKNDSDVRASGRSYSGLPKRSLSTPAGGNLEERGDKKRKIDRRRRKKH